MNQHSKKMIAPVVIAVCIILYYAAVGIALLFVGNIALVIKIPILIIPLAIIGVSVFVLRERIKEIRSGEEDDLSQY